MPASPPPRSPRKPLHFTFANHMHWVDMQWLWGYDVLPGSVADMLRLCWETGVKGNVNFDGVGYEKMAAECPEALVDLRAAVGAGTVEPVGCSYGQPYGLFHGGESNVRQLTYGARSVRRLLGVRPISFWEEEFYFFPQLAQMLASCGFTGACLFFQWTWHTPEVPKEAHSLVLWEGLDGTRLPVLPRNDLNLHQWPEDFGPMFASPLLRDLERPVIAQWVELMPSKDWMCRAEVLLPRLQELLADGRYTIQPGTLSEVLATLAAPGAVRAADGSPPVRAYTMDDVWHGMSLGKNGDAHPRASRRIENAIVAAEALSSLAGLFGRPYASWDVYPTWELEEAWRELLAAQHHDNHECEGLCGFIGDASFARAEALAAEVAGRTAKHLAGRVPGRAGALVAFNPTGMSRDIHVPAADGQASTIVRQVPPFGYAVIEPGSAERPAARTSVARQPHEITLSRGPLRITIDPRRGLLTQIATADFPRGLLDPAHPLGTISMRHGGEDDGFEGASTEVTDNGGEPEVTIVRSGRAGAVVTLKIRIGPLADAVELAFAADNLPKSDRAMHAGLQTRIAPGFPIDRIVTDHPYGQSSVRAEGVFSRKYPTGDWMTSPQVFEQIHRPFTALTWTDLLDPSGARGLLCVHDGAQQFFREGGGSGGGGVRNLLWMYDPWDQDRWSGRLRARLTLLPHGPLSDGERARAAASLAAAGTFATRQTDVPADAPARFGLLSIEGAPHVQAHAVYRESMKCGEHFPDWAGHRMFRDSGGVCTHPFVVRLVEWGGEPAQVTLKLPGPVALAVKTNLMGEVGPGVGTARDTAWLTVEPADPPDWARAATLRGELIPWSQVRFPMRPREIATVMADLTMARKQFRDLDAKREVWSTIHRAPRRSEQQP
jgi:alpha-mannosidase